MARDLLSDLDDVATNEDDIPAQDDCIPDEDWDEFMEGLSDYGRAAECLQAERQMNLEW